MTAYQGTDSDKDAAGNEVMVRIECDRRLPHAAVSGIDLRRVDEVVGRYPGPIRQIQPAR